MSQLSQSVQVIIAVDWRLYSQTHSLTDKQQKLADKIRRQELKIHNLRTETDRIRVSATAAACKIQQTSRTASTLC